MTDRLQLIVQQTQLEQELDEDLKKVRWPISHGDVTINIRDGEPTLSHIHLTCQHDVKKRK